MDEITPQTNVDHRSFGDETTTQKRRLQPGIFPVSAVVQKGPRTMEQRSDTGASARPETTEEVLEHIAGEISALRAELDRRLGRALSLAHFHLRRLEKAEKRGGRD